VPFEIANVGPTIGIERLPTGGYELTFDADVVARITRRGRGPWTLIDLADIGFDGMRFPSAANTETLPSLVLDAVSKWLRQHRSDLMTPRTHERRTSAVEASEVDTQLMGLQAMVKAAATMNERHDISVEDQRRLAAHMRAYVEGTLSVLRALRLISSDEARDCLRRSHAELGPNE
jgi:hypothetical protein